MQLSILRKTNQKQISPKKLILIGVGVLAVSGFSSVLFASFNVEVALWMFGIINVVAFILINIGIARSFIRLSEEKEDDDRMQRKILGSKKAYVYHRKSRKLFLIAFGIPSVMFLLFSVYAVVSNTAGGGGAVAVIFAVVYPPIGLILFITAIVYNFKYLREKRKINDYTQDKNYKIKMVVASIFVSIAALVFLWNLLG